MKNLQLTLNSILSEGYYRISYRCTNCGAIFEEDIKKGVLAVHSECTCRYCGTMSNKTKGYFEVIKHNTELDKPLTKYY